MRSIIVIAGLGFGILSACSGGSGAPSGTPVAQLSDQEYTSLCKYYNDKAKALVGQQCGDMTIMQASTIPCGTTNVLRGSSCAARVADVEACVNSTNVCVATGRDAPASQCLIVNNCFPNR